MVIILIYSCLIFLRLALFYANIVLNGYCIDIQLIKQIVYLT